MLRPILSICLLMVMAPAFSQTSFNQINVGPDSSEFFLQKGIQEKQNGRRLESLKYFEKAISYDANNKAVTAELASAYLDLRLDNTKSPVTGGDCWQSAQEAACLYTRDRNTLWLLAPRQSQIDALSAAYPAFP